MHQGTTKEQQLLDNLKRKHKSLDNTIKTLYNKSYNNEKDIHDMKKQKLYLKDQITKLEKGVQKNG